ncbi:MAG: GatB/YqeY domain-containing protein [Gammaproteobacteria bacterium]|nr:GatB/YqeY domain-containing protein [Gammaproteobacteria bacterium]MBT8123673.1 GatB/YqeY domain-containing protein [Gammaproteobacteria bacterium]NNC68627.1 GatB/YqeY domain-containing protein [Gammaproteobacteria bacterium]
MSELKTKLTEDMKTAMRSGDKSRLQTIRLILSAVKQQEVDTREEQSDDDIIASLTKMQKQRRESISQFEQAGRKDLVDKEEQELVVISEYLPAALSDDEIDKLIAGAMTESGASSIKDMGKVMGILKPKLAGRADMGAVSAKIKSALA